MKRGSRHLPGRGSSILSKPVVGGSPQRLWRWRGRREADRPGGGHSGGLGFILKEGAGTGGLRGGDTAEFAAREALLAAVESGRKACRSRCG